MDNDPFNTSRDGSVKSKARSVASEYVRQQSHPSSSTPPKKGGIIANAIGRVANPVIGAVDVDAIIQRVDVNDVLLRVDWNAIVDEIDWNNLLEKVDMDALLDRVDVNRAVERVDVNGLIDRSNLKQIIARSTSGMCSIVMDRFRAICIKIDQIVQRMGRCACCTMMCCTKQKKWTLPPYPDILPVLHAKERRADLEKRRSLRCPKNSTSLALAVQGRNAGTFSRFLAYAIDKGLTIGLGMLAIVVISSWLKLLPEDRIPDSAVALLTDFDNNNETLLEEILLANPDLDEEQLLSMTDEQFAQMVVAEIEEENEEEAQQRLILGFSLPVFVVSCLSFLIDGTSMAVVGRTIGKAIMGLTVVNSSMGKVGHITLCQAAIRSALYNFCGPIVWFGVIFNLCREDRRSFIDMLCGTTVIYAWDAKAFKMASNEFAKESPYGGLQFESLTFDSSTAYDSDEEMMPLYNDNDNNNNNTGTLSPGRAAAVPKGFLHESGVKNRSRGISELSGDYEA